MAEIYKVIREPIWDTRIMQNAMDINSILEYREFSKDEKIKNECLALIDKLVEVAHSLEILKVETSVHVLVKS